MMNRCPKKIIYIIISFILAVTVIGIWFWYTNSFELPLTRTHGGILFEELLPSETVFAASFNPNSAEERMRFQTLWNAVLQDKKDAVIPFLAQKLIGTDIEISLTDIEMLFVPASSFTIALVPQEENAEDVEDIKNTETVEGTDSIENANSRDGVKRPDFYFLFSVENPAQALAILERNKDVISKEIQFGVVGDTAFVTNSGDEGVAALIKRSTGRGKSFASSRLFKKTFSKITLPISGYLYMAPDEETGQMLPFPAMPTMTMSDEIGGMSGIGASIVALHSSEKGFYMDSFSLGDKKSAQESGMQQWFEPHTAYLFKKIPAKNTILFAEGHNLAAFFNMPAFEQIFNNKDIFPLGTLPGFKDITGLDYKEEVAPFLDKGYVVTLQDTATVIPAISIFIDASSAPEKAKAIVEKLNANVPAWISLGNLALKNAAQANGTGEPAGESAGDIFEMKNFETLPAGASVRIYLNRISQDTAKIPLFEITKTPIELSYGMTEDDILFFSTLRDIENALLFPQTIEEDALFKEIATLGVDPGDIAIIDTAAIWEYVGRLFSLAREQGTLSETNEKVFDILEKHLSVVEGFVQVSQGDSVNAFGKSLIKITTGDTAQGD